MKRLFKICLVTFAFCIFSVSSSVAQPQLLDFRVEADLIKASKYFKEKDYVNSLKSFQKIYKKEPAAASYYLGEHYYKGFGVEVNIEKALKYYKHGAIFDDSWCEERLCSHFFSNLDDINNHKQIFYWSHVASLNPKGVEYGSKKTTYVLAYCYFNGIGVEKNNTKGKIWMTLSAILDYDEACKYIQDKEKKDSLDKYDLYVQLDSLILPALTNDESIEAKVVKCLSYYRNSNYKEFHGIAKELLSDSKLSKTGRYFIYDLLYDYYKDYKDDKYNAEIIEDEKNKLGEVTLYQAIIWSLKQYVKCLDKHFW